MTTRVRARPLAGRLGFLLVLGPWPTLSAQARPSQHASVMQVIGATEVTIVYNRPSARGRQLFGGLVPWGRVWCPGADQATTIAFSSDVQVAGQPLKAGKYSVWAIPDPAEWTLIFSSATDVWHVPYPGQPRDALRFKAKPEAGPFLETLVFYFPVVEADRAVVNLAWGETRVPIPITLR